MAEREENSALIALAELRNLEADRVASEDAKRRAKEEAERKAREEAERKVREAAERKAREEAERIAREQAEREARDREERLRLQEAELRARAEQERLLREEQLRLDAQVKMTEKNARPLWLKVTPVILGIGLIVGGVIAKNTIDEQNQLAEQERNEARKRDEENRKAQEALMAELKGLKSEQERLAREKAELDAKLDKVTDEAERARLLAEIDKKNAELAANQAKQTRGSGGGKKSSSGDSGTITPKKPGIEVKKTDDPLDGL